MSGKENWSGRNPEKDKLRNHIWSLLKKKGITKEDPFYTIPDFIGSRKAADKLAELDVWKSATVMMCCPDPPQIPVRLKALEKGMIVYMAFFLPKKNNISPKCR